MASNDGSGIVDIIAANFRSSRTVLAIATAGHTKGATRRLQQIQVKIDIQYLVYKYLVF
jgi:hypothetical protein